MSGDAGPRGAGSLAASVLRAVIGFLHRVGEVELEAARAAAAAAALPAPMPVEAHPEPLPPARNNPWPALLVLAGASALATTAGLSLARGTLWPPPPSAVAAPAIGFTQRASASPSSTYPFQLDVVIPSNGGASPFIVRVDCDAGYIAPDSTAIVTATGLGALTSTQTFGYRGANVPAHIAAREYNLAVIEVDSPAIPAQTAVKIRFYSLEPLHVSSVVAGRD